MCTSGTAQALRGPKACRTPEGQGELTVATREIAEARVLTPLSSV